MQFGGIKMRNVCYPKPLIAIKMSNKEGVAIDNVFCPSRFACQNLKIQKILIFHRGTVRTSRLTLYNPFGHQSTQSASLGQINQNAPGQP